MDGRDCTPHGIQFLDVIPTVQCGILPAMVTGKLPVIRLARCGPQVKLLSEGHEVSSFPCLEKACAQSHFNESPRACFRDPQNISLLPLPLPLPMLLLPKWLLYDNPPPCHT